MGWADPGRPQKGCSEQPGEVLQGTHSGVSPRRSASPPRHPRRSGSSSFTSLAANFPKTPNTAENHSTTHTKDAPDACSDTTGGAQIPFQKPHGPVASLLAQTAPTGPLPKQPRHQDGSEDPKVLGEKSSGLPRGRGEDLKFLLIAKAAHDPSPPPRARQIGAAARAGHLINRKEQMINVCFK